MIVLDTRMIAHSGIGTYIRGLLSGFTPGQLRELALLGDPAQLKAFPCRVEPAFEPIYSVREQWAMPQRLKKLHPRLFHSPHYNVPVAYSGRMVATIHDVNHILFPSLSRSRLALWYARAMLPALYRKARRILTDSENTRRDLVRFGAPPDKLRVVRLAVEERFKPVDRDDAAAAVARFDLKPGYFFYLGNVRPIKNIGGLLEAYALLKEKRPDAPPLILAGRKDMDFAARDGVRWIGEIPSENLPALYAAAAAFVFPSLYEGFGLPPLEAMACGCAVVSSTGGSLPEILGDAAACVDPKDTRALADTMERVWTDRTFREDLSRKGLERIRGFSWAKTASETFKVYAEALSA